MADLVVGQISSPYALPFSLEKISALGESFTHACMKVSLLINYYFEVYLCVYLH